MIPHRGCSAPLRTTKVRLGKLRTTPWPHLANSPTDADPRPPLPQATTTRPSRRRSPAAAAASSSGVAPSLAVPLLPAVDLAAGIGGPRAAAPPPPLPPAASIPAWPAAAFPPPPAAAVAATPVAANGAPLRPTPRHAGEGDAPPMTTSTDIVRMFMCKPGRRASSASMPPSRASLAQGARMSAGQSFLPDLTSTVSPSAAVVPDAAAAASHLSPPAADDGDISAFGAPVHAAFAAPPRAAAAPPVNVDGLLYGTGYDVNGRGYGAAAATPASYSRPSLPALPREPPPSGALLSPVGGGGARASVGSAYELAAPVTRLPGPSGGIGSAVKRGRVGIEGEAEAASAPPA